MESKGIKESENDDRLELSAWLEHLLDSGRISEEEINDFFFEELMSGKRQLVRIYSLKSVRKMKRVQDWTDFVREYDCPDLSFNRIISTSLSDEDVKVCAINSKIFDGKIQKIELIFVYKIKLEKDNSISATYSYIPVVFDFTDRKLTIKVWNRDDVCEGYRPMEQLDWIFNRLQDLLDFEIMPASVKAQKVLYRMSKALFDEFYGHLPFVELLEDMGMTENTIFCSSCEGYNISWGKDIYGYLAKEFKNDRKNLMVLFMLSDNYYKSPACLNEMGATWILKKDYRSILLPGFEYEDIDGAINAQQIGIKLDDANLNMQLNEIKRQFSDIFNLAHLSDNKWDRVRESFIKKITDIRNSKNKAAE